MSGMSLCPAFVWEVFGTSFSGQSRWWNLEFVLKNPCQQLALLVSLLVKFVNEAMHVPWPRVWKLWQVLAAQFSDVFGTIVLMKFVLKKKRANSCAFLVSLPVTKLCVSHRPTFALEKSSAHSFAGQSHWWNLSWKPVPTALLLSMSLPPSGALPKLFPTVSHPSVMSKLAPCSLPTELSPFPTASYPSTVSTLPSRSLPPELSPSYSPYFLWFPIRPQRPRFHPAPSQRSSPLFPTVSCPSSDVHASVSLPPNGTLPKLFPTVSHPSTVSTLPSRSLPTELSPSHPSTVSALPSRSLLRELSHGFLSIHDVHASVSLPPNGVLPNKPLPKLFPTVSWPSTLSFLPYRSPGGKVN